MKYDDRENGADDQNEEDYQSANDQNCGSDACEPGDERVKDVVNVGHASQHTFTAARRAANLAAEIDVPLDYVGKCLGFGTQALERVVKLERQNYGLDLKEGDDKAPEAELTDEELEVRIAKLTQQVGGEQ